MRGLRDKEKSGHAEPSPEEGPSDRRPLTSEELLNLVRPQDPVLSRDGSLIAFIVKPSYTEKGSGYEGRLWIGAPPNPPRQATRGPGLDSLPAFSPVDDRLAFASDRSHSGRLSVHLLEPRHGEAVPIGEVPGTVEETQPAEPIV